MQMSPEHGTQRGAGANHHSTTPPLRPPPAGPSCYNIHTCVPFYDRPPGGGAVPPHWLSHAARLLQRLAVAVAVQASHHSSRATPSGGDDTSHPIPAGRAPDEQHDWLCRGHRTSAPHPARLPPVPSSARTQLRCLPGTPALVT